VVQDLKSWDGKAPKRLVYAYDELQNLSNKSIASPEDIFGRQPDGSPIVTLQNLPNRPKQDIILEKCYRNPGPILTAAHALGFGIYHEPSLIQMFDNAGLWEEIGYEVTAGRLHDGQDVTLARTPESSPDFLQNHSPIDDLISFHAFDSYQEQDLWLVSEIERNLDEDELKPNDIMVVHCNPLTTRDATSAARAMLFKKEINNNLAGVTNSPDQFFGDKAVTFTSIYRAKGNEAALVYIINANEIFAGKELARKRNILFTAMTRSKAWVRVLGVGPLMPHLVAEYKRVVDAEFRLRFRYPTAEQRQEMNVVHRDMTDAEKRTLQKKKRQVDLLARDLERGDLSVDDLSPETILRLKKALKKK
jgi:superfamily I DNA and RNA helicase